MPDLTNDDKIEVLQKIAEENNWSFREDYSGRGMRGTACVGITVEYHDEMIACIEEAAIAGVRGAHMDNMGRGYIVYWPSVETAPKKEEEDD